MGTEVLIGNYNDTWNLPINNSKAQAQGSRTFSTERAIKDSYFNNYFHESLMIFSNSKYD